MGVDLLKHNQEAYEKIKSAIADGKNKIAISHATGTGKSYLVAKLFEDYCNDKKLVLVPSRYIKEQIQKLFEKYDIENVDIILYQKLIKMSDEDIAGMDYGVIALDEYHHDAATKVWGEKVKLLIDSHPESIIFGTSATPVRTDGVNTIDVLFEGNCASDLPLSESIAKKIVPLPVYVGALYTLDDELEKLRKKIENATNTKEEKQEFYKKINTMCSQIEKSYGMPIILNKHIKDKEGKYIVFCKNKKHLAEIKDVVIDWFKTAGFKDINAYVVHSSYEEKDKGYRAFCDDTSSSLKLLFCVDMLNEGLHLENISGVLLLRPTRSSIVWHQQIGRAIEANNTNTPVIIDAVNNFSAIGQGMELLKEIKNAMAKEKESNPEFDDSGFVDIDTFFVLEQVLDIQEMFKEIEGRLQGREWSEEEDEIFRKYYHIEGTNIIKRLNNRTRQAIQVHASKLGLNFSHFWTEEEEEILVKCFQDIGAEGIVEKKLLPNHSFNSIKSKAYKLGLTYKNGHRYRPNKNDDKILIENYSVCGKKVLDLLPHMTENQVKHRAKQLGLFFNNNKWTENEKKVLKEDYNNLPIEEVMKKLPNRNKSAIIAFASKNGIASNRNIEWSKEEDEKLYSLYPKQGAKMFSELSNKTKNQIQKRLAFLGIKKENSFDIKMELVKKAAREGVIISKNNPFYEDINLYEWKIYNRKRFTKKEWEIINKVIPSAKLQIPIKMEDFESKSIKFYLSIILAAHALQKDFCISLEEESIVEAIRRRVGGKVTTPYKGRFMFYPATDEEIKKYLSDNKAS